ncbi:MAG: hypothetical protein V3V28_12930 [Polaribacter sp.]|uniref:hypothetical protein n=1 Tax=Polaribacter sp. TaxID=1920175 RepID=UPI002F3515BC
MIILFTSCDKFSFSKNKNNQQTVDTIVIFSSVDTSPSFKICDSIIDKNKKTDCFRTSIHQEIGVELSQFSFSVKDSISEIIYVDLIINSKGEIVLDKIKSPENIKIALPELDSLLKVSVNSLPNIYPAIKRGIPVTTKYTLPIKIELTE